MPARALCLPQHARKKPSDHVVAAGTGVQEEEGGGRRRSAGMLWSYCCILHTTVPSYCTLYYCRLKYSGSNTS